MSGSLNGHRCTGWRQVDTTFDNGRHDAYCSCGHPHMWHTGLGCLSRKCHCVYYIDMDKCYISGCACGKPKHEQGTADA